MAADLCSFGESVDWERNRPQNCALDNGTTKPLLDDAGILRHGKRDGESESLFSRDKTAEFLTQGGWKHGNSALDKVNTGCPLTCVAVKGSIGLNKERNIGNMNRDIICAIAVDFDRQSVIKIFSSLRVDSKHAFSAEIATSLKLALGNAMGTWMRV